MNNATLKQNFERELLFQLISNLRRENMDIKKAQKIAKAFMPILQSDNENEEFMDKVSNISKFYPEANEAFISTVRDYDSQKIKEELAKVREELGGVN